MPRLRIFQRNGVALIPQGLHFGRVGIDIRCAVLIVLPIRVTTNADQF
jgi:hypothetical protein